MATPCSSALQLDLRDTFGAFVVAIIISSCLYGVTCLQTWYYFQNYNDRFLLRGIVLAILMLETLHVILVVHAIYRYLILNFANPFASVIEIWSAVVSGLHLAPLYCKWKICDRLLYQRTTAIDLIVYMFYAARVRHKKDWWTPTVVCILKATQVDMCSGQHHSIVNV
ncbi:hypothetical protein WG66_014552 [Moniliophthora roreri]|nr:hypothetical protein WG66_014552 [Moniliophthora roreri]